MPYKIEQRGDKWVTVNKDTGSVKGTHANREKALAQMRLLYGIEGGMTPRKSKSKKYSKSVVKKARLGGEK